MSQYTRCQTDQPATTQRSAELQKYRRNDYFHRHPYQIAALLVSIGLSFTPSAFGQWSGEVELAAVGDSVDEGLDSFRSQYNLDDGFGLEDLGLQYIAEDGALFSVTASGFGTIEPVQHAALIYKPKAPWEFSLDYDRRESFFFLNEFEQPSRADDWNIERWHANARFDGWSAASLNLDLRYQQRDGQVTRPLYALNELYPLQVDLDETLREASFSLETRLWPGVIRLVVCRRSVRDALRPRRLRVRTSCGSVS